MDDANRNFRISDLDYSVIQVPSSLSAISNNLPPLILGTNQSEVLVTKDKAERLDAKGGDDRISTRAGDDQISGGLGNDTIDAGDDDDLVFGYSGDDHIRGGEGNDVLIGANPVFGFGDGEQDTLKGGLGEDIFVLGDLTHLYYDDGDPTSIGESDYALITDLKVGQDFIQLKDAAEFYNLDFYTTASGKIKADLIYDPGVAARGELIAILNNVSSDLKVTDFLLPDDKLQDPSFIGGTDYTAIYNDSFAIYNNSFGGFITITSTGMSISTLILDSSPPPISSREPIKMMFYQVQMRGTLFVVSEAMILSLVLIVMTLSLVVKVEILSLVVRAMIGSKVVRAMTISSVVRAMTLFLVVKVEILSMVVRGMIGSKVVRAMTISSVVRAMILSLVVKVEILSMVVMVLILSMADKEMISSSGLTFHLGLGLLNRIL